MVETCNGLENNWTGLKKKYRIKNTIKINDIKVKIETYTTTI